MSDVAALPSQSLISLEHGHELPPPVFVLAPARSFTSVVCAMIGQHPECYGLPETNLFCHRTVGARAQRASTSAHVSLNHGLIRVIAELYFGGQTESAVPRARRWLTQRSTFTTEFLFQTIMDRVFPRTVIEKSPNNVSSVQCLRRMRRLEGARFIHLLRHPRGHGESVMKALDHERRTRGPLAPGHWLSQIVSYRPAEDEGWGQPPRRGPDPQYWWYARNRTILEFLRSVPDADQIRIRGEDLLNHPDEQLRALAGWIGVSTDRDSIKMMKHPERSPYAFLGPRGARFGNDEFFLQDPGLRSGQARAHRLGGPLRWRADGQELIPEVMGLAREFGYT